MTWRDEFWSLVYDYRPHLWMLFMFLVFMLLLTLLSFVFGQPNTASYTIACVNLLFIGGLGVIVLGMYYYSAKRRTNF